jgi:hypothetical protein
MSILRCEDRRTGRVEEFDLDSQEARTRIILAAKEHNTPVAEVMHNLCHFWLHNHITATQILSLPQGENT